MTTPRRIAVNGRILQSSADPLARLSAASLVRRLSAEPDLALHVIAPQDRDGPRPAGRRLGAAYFDQVHFPRAAGRLDADLLLYLHSSAPIVGSAPSVSWFADGEESSIGWRRGRLERSLGLAGLRGAAAVLRPSDAPEPALDLAWVSVPALVPDEVFAEGSSPAASRDANLPDAFVLCLGETDETFPLILAAWTWVESSLGDSYFLVVPVRDETGRLRVKRAAEVRGLAETVRAVILPDVDWGPAFHRASALLHGAGVGNAAALRWALAAGLPVAALTSPVSQSIVGPAGYLTGATARELGAGCLTLLVEESVAQPMRERGRERARRFSPPAAAAEWGDVLRRVARSRDQM